VSREYNESCCWTIEKFSFFHNYFAIIDTADYLADQLLPTAVESSNPCCTMLFGVFSSKKDEVAACLFHCFHPRISPCGSACGSSPLAI